MCGRGDRGATADRCVHPVASAGGREVFLKELGAFETHLIINQWLMAADSSPDRRRKAPLNVGAGLGEVEECRNFNLRGPLGFWRTPVPY